MQYSLRTHHLISEGAESFIWGGWNSTHYMRKKKKKKKKKNLTHLMSDKNDHPNLYTDIQENNKTLENFRGKMTRSQIPALPGSLMVRSSSFQ